MTPGLQQPPPVLHQEICSSCSLFLITRVISYIVHVSHVLISCYDAFLSGSIVHTELMWILTVRIENEIKILCEKIKKATKNLFNLTADK